MSFIKQIAEGFIARRGKMQEHIPIKKTGYHKAACLKPGHAETECPDEQTQGGYQQTIEKSRQDEMLMTPAQRARARKEEKARQREQELINAVKRDSSYNSALHSKADQMRSHLDRTNPSQTFNLSAKHGDTTTSTIESKHVESRLIDRKNIEDSFGFQDKTMQSLDMNTIQSQNLTGIQGIKKTYQYEFDDTVVSQNIPTQDYNRQAFNPNAAYGQSIKNNSNSYSMGEKEIMGDTIDSMNYSGTNNNPNWAKGGDETIQSQYEDTGRYQHLAQQAKQQHQSQNNNSYYDHENRPCAGKQNYSDSMVGQYDDYSGNPNNFKKGSPQGVAMQQPIEAPDYEDDFEDFEDDFEDYNSDDEDRIYNDMRDRITDMADPNEMTAVMDIYQDYLENPVKESKLSTIRET